MTGLQRPCSYRTSCPCPCLYKGRGAVPQVGISESMTVGLPPLGLSPTAGSPPELVRRSVGGVGSVPNGRVTPRAGSRTATGPSLSLLSSPPSLPSSSSSRRRSPGVGRAEQSVGGRVGKALGTRRGVGLVRGGVGRALGERWGLRGVTRTQTPGEGPLALRDTSMQGFGPNAPNSRVTPGACTGPTIRALGGGPQGLGMHPRRAAKRGTRCGRSEIDGGTHPARSLASMFAPSSSVLATWLTR